MLFWKISFKGTKCLHKRILPSHHHKFIKYGHGSSQLCYIRQDLDTEIASFRQTLELILSTAVHRKEGCRKFLLSFWFQIFSHYNFLEIDQYPGPMRPPILWWWFSNLTFVGGDMLWPWSPGGQLYWDHVSTWPPPVTWPPCWPDTRLEDGLLASSSLSSLSYWQTASLPWTFMCFRREDGWV